MFKVGDRVKLLTIDNLGVWDDSDIVWLASDYNIKVGDIFTVIKVGDEEEVKLDEIGDKGYWVHPCRLGLYKKVSNEERIAKRMEELSNE